VRRQKGPGLELDPDRIVIAEPVFRLLAAPPLFRSGRPRRVSHHRAIVEAPIVRPERLVSRPYRLGRTLIMNPLEAFQRSCDSMLQADSGRAA